MTIARSGSGDYNLCVPIVLRSSRIRSCDLLVGTTLYSFTLISHYCRRLRTLSCARQLCAWRPSTQIPARNSICVELVSYTLLRFVSPYPFALAVLSVGALLLSRRPPPTLVAVVEIALSAPVVLAFLSRRLRKAALPMRAAVAHALGGRLHGEPDVWCR